MKSRKFKYLIGIDEVGRGPVAGPVAVCASIVRFDDVRVKSQKLKNIFKGGSKISESKKLPILRDSKRLSEAGREAWFEHLITAEGLHFSLSYSSAKEIDKKGIAVCIRSLINKNLRKLQEKIKFKSNEVLILLDGSLKAPEDFIYQETIIGGDDKEPIISFASIYAKVSRDRLMEKIGKKYPDYYFEKHKGYGTKQHIESIRKHGLSIEHRKTFLTRI